MRRASGAASATTRDKLAVSSTKSMTGHLLGAAGGIEAVFTVLAIRDQVAPPTANLVDRDPKCDLDFVPLTARPMKHPRRDVELVRFRRHQRDARVPRALTRHPVALLTRSQEPAMALIVQKYGGTSVGTTDRIKNVARRVARFHREGHQLVVVVSAMTGETNRLLALAKELSPNPNPRELDVVAATGEQVTIGLLAIALEEMGYKAKSYTGGQVRILTDNAFTKARILSIDEENMRADLEAGTIVIVAGFQGVDAEEQHHHARARRLRHLRRRARRGAEGRRVPDLHRRRRRLHDRSADRARGAPPRHRHLRGNARDGEPRLEGAADPVGRVRRQVQGQAARAVLARGPEVTSHGTLITFEEDHSMEQAIISGIAFTRDEAKISVMGVEDKPGIAYAILGPIAAANIDVDMIVQNIGASGHTDFSFTVNRAEYQKALDVLARERGKVFKAREIIGDNRICKVSVVGIGMRSHVGLASKMFKALADEGINIQMISTSEIKISVVIDEKYLELAVRVLHQAFGLDKAAGRRGLSRV